MSDFGLGKVFDALAGALNIFDFSFLISGSATLALILADICMHTGTEWLLTMMKWPGWIIVVVALLSIYICGIIAWMIGRELREGFLTFTEDENAQEGSNAEKDFNRVYTKLIESLEIKGEDIPTIKRKMDVYSYLWIKLESIDNEKVRERLAYCNRFWVMRALLEGLLFTWLLLIGVLIDMVITCHLLQHMCIAYFVLLFFVMIILMYFTAMRATSFANDQVKEIIITYKVYIIDKEKND